MRNIELNHLKYFYFTVIEGGVTAAANRLYVQQPVVSKTLKTLEDSLEKPLFWKQGRTKELTDYGQMVFRHCQVIFEELKQIEDLDGNQVSLPKSLSFGGAEPIVNYLFPKVFPKLIKDYDKTNFNVYSSTQKQLLQMINDSKLDLGAFFYVHKLPADLEITDRIAFNFRLVVRKDLKANKETLSSFIGSREIDDTSTHKFPL